MKRKRRKITAFAAVFLMAAAMIPSMAFCSGYAAGHRMGSF